MLRRAIFRTTGGSQALRNCNSLFSGTGQSAVTAATIIVTSRHRANSIGNKFITTSANKIGRDPHQTPRTFAAAKSDLRSSCISGHNSRRQFSQTVVCRDSPYAAAEISVDEFHGLADRYIERLMEELEALADERKEVDVEYSSGVLTLVLPPAGTYVINKQPPNRQIWLSSPVSGPKRYDWAVPSVGAGGEGGEEEGGKGTWVYLRDGTRLNDLLAEEVGIDIAVLEEATEE